MTVASRDQLKKYCLRALGAPVLEINVDDDQLEDRIDEALEYWRLYHHEGIEKVYLKQN
jgi:tryptophan synthase beta subunit